MSISQPEPTAQAPYGATCMLLRLTRAEKNLKKKNLKKLTPQKKVEKQQK